MASTAYAAFQWTVRLVVYPQFRAVPPAAIPAYEQSHSRRITRVVGPLFAALVVLAVLLLLARPDDVPLWAALGSAGLVLAVLGLTAVVAVPAHRALGAAWDPSAYRRLLHVDSARAIAATLNVVLAGYLAVR